MSKYKVEKSIIAVVVLGVTLCIYVYFSNKGSCEDSGGVYNTSGQCINKQSIINF